MPDNRLLPYQSIRLADYTYHLPREKIAQYPLARRDESRLLTYRQGQITHRKFNQLPQFLPDNSLLVLNNTRVLPARLFFQKATGAIIEVFLLEPLTPTREMSTAMLASGKCCWKCVIGNKKRWKNGEALKLYSKTEKFSTLIQAELVDFANNVVEFNFSSALPFSQVLDQVGNMPLPPYMNRLADEQDQERYQTVFGKVKGAVAAPTASLHFTDQTLHQLREQGHSSTELTLHVGAGTFQPIKDDDVAGHPMHQEWFQVSLNSLEMLEQHRGPVVPVGTTACRTLESLYWLGTVLLMHGQLWPTLPKDIAFHFEPANLPSRRESLKSLIAYLRANQQDSLSCSTEIFIIPGYNFKLTDGLVTNFHQPGSTLILLIAALLGDNWKKVYNEALNHNYRFLSYGDSSLLVP